MKPDPRCLPVICPGVHDPALTHQGLQALALTGEYLVFPTETYPAFSALHVLIYLHHYLARTGTAPGAIAPLFIGFSAGVVAAAGAAWAWEWQGGRVRGLIALDGWGMPLTGKFPIHRLSHDGFTHCTSLGLGGGDQPSFYADPPVPHLTLWRSPQHVPGWQFPGCSPTWPRPSPRRTTAAAFLIELITHYQM